MIKKLDLKLVQAALDRAAYDAMHGPPEARSGRFMRESVVKAEKHAGGLAQPGKRAS